MTFNHTPMEKWKKIQEIESQLLDQLQKVFGWKEEETQDFNGRQCINISDENARVKIKEGEKIRRLVSNAIDEIEEIQCSDFDYSTIKKSGGWDYPLWGKEKGKDALKYQYVPRTEEETKFWALMTAGREFSRAFDKLIVEWADKAQECNAQVQKLF